MDINFEYYKIFYYVAKYQNITKAARVLGSNQPNVTRILKLLESQLGRRLFIREARGVSLTEEGELLFSHVEIAYRQLLNAQEELCKQDAQRCGTVEIGATETAIYLFLLDALHGFQAQYPAVKIKIHNHTTPETVRHLISGKLDFAVLTIPFEMPKTIFCEKVLEFEEILVGGLQYKNLCQSLLELKDMEDYPWIGLSSASATYKLYKDFFIQHKIDLEPDMQVETSGLMLPMIENNLGIGFVPQKLAEPLLAQKKLVQIHLNCEIPKRSVQIAADKGRGKSLAADTLYKYLRGKSVVNMEEV